MTPFKFNIFKKFKKLELFTIRHLCTKLKLNQKKLKPFSSVPSLTSYPILGHSYLFLGGKYKAEKLTEAIEDLSKSLGQIFKLKLGGTNLLITLNPDHTQILFANEGKLPIRPPFPALLYFRRKAYNSVGVVPGNGDEWYKFRGGVTPLLKNNLSIYKDRHVEVAKSFCNYIERNRSSDLILKDVFQHLLLYTIEAISVICPGQRFNCLDNKDNKETKRIIKASVDFMDGLYSTLIGLPLWKIYKNSGYKKLESSHTTIHNIIKEILQLKKQEYNKDPIKLKTRDPYLYTLFENKNLSWNDQQMLALEVFLGGIDATATTIAFMLHYLAFNKDSQETARRECLQNENFPYLKACVKETLRLRPTAGANSRFLIHDTDIGGFLIPKGTLVSAFSSVSSHQLQYFIEPNKFRPERWLRNNNETVHRFASLPFGHGPRMCPGRKIAESEIVILFKELLTRYTLHPVGEENIGMVYRMNRIPEKSINIKFINTNF